MQRKSEELQLAMQEYLDVDWTSVKYYLRRQIAKCVQECKSQASNAKRIARTIKHKDRSRSDGVDTNGAYDSEDDSDDWGTDFEDDSEDEVKSDNLVNELNNNTIIQSTADTSGQNSSSSLSQEKYQLRKSIPKPPDVPVISKSINGPIGRRNSPSHTNSIPRPPVKRPPSQPPPPPVAQVPSQDLVQEDYEIPIVSTGPSTRENSEHSDCSFHSVISSEFAAETYELIEPPEETYEMVDGSATSPELKKTIPLPPLPPRISPLGSDETAQNMATRPLPPVPVPKQEKPINIQQEDLQSYPWYHEIERQTAEEVVRSLNESGSFVVRPSKRAGIDNPYSLTIFHDDKLFHLNIRHRPDNTFALGKEKKKEKAFLNVADLITFHMSEPILLTSRGEPAGKTILCKYPEKS